MLRYFVIGVLYVLMVVLRSHGAEDIKWAFDKQSVKPIPAPVEPIPAPVKPIPAPVKPIPAPVKPTPAPVKPATITMVIPPGHHAHTRTDGTVIVHADSIGNNAAAHVGVPWPWYKTGFPGQTVTIQNK